MKDCKVDMLVLPAAPREGALTDAERRAAQLEHEDVAACRVCFVERRERRFYRVRELRLIGPTYFCGEHQRSASLWGEDI